MKTKIFTFFILAVMLLSVRLSHAQILTDGDFSTTTSIYPYCCEVPPSNQWNSYKNVGIDANATVVAGVCDYQLINAGSQAWEVQLEQLGFPLIQGHLYRLTFDVKADEERDFGVFLGQYGGGWTNLLGYENYWQHATTEWNTISVDFQANCVFDLHKFSFEIGGNNVSMYFDNIVVEDLGPYSITIGILGSALNGWDVDVDMQTTDGITYTLTNYPLNSGEAKFRQDNGWCINWGNTDFPSGTGYQDGPNIPISCAWNYDITFSIETGEYKFAPIDAEPPVVTVISDQLAPLWPANHKLIPVYIDYSSSDNSCETHSELVVTSNEPINGQGDGDMTPDWIIIDEHNILLKAERSGNGTGRVYTINIVCYDDAGNSSSKQVTVSVPHDEEDLKVAEGTIESGNQATSLLNKYENNQINIQAWPNPAIRNFNLKVQSSSTEIIDVYVTDVSGRLVSGLKTKNAQTINFGDDLRPGMYFIKIKQGGNLKTIKVVKQ